MDFQPRYTAKNPLTEPYTIRSHHAHVLRETHQKRADGSVMTHLQLAESAWNPQKKRLAVRIVYNCGRAEDPQTVERLRKLAS